MSGRRDVRVAPAVLTIPLAAALATWSLVGDRSEPDGYLELAPAGPEVPRAVELGVGVTAVGVAALALLVVDRVAGPRGRRALAALVIAGVVAGGGARVVTAATVGANIGGGMVLMAGPPLVLGLLGAAHRWWPRT